MNAYTLMLKLIAVGKKSKEELLNLCEVYYAAGRLSDEEYRDLLNKINK